MSFCVTHHCKTQDQRCTGCEICGAKRADIATSTAAAQCPLWCSATQNGHCGVDERCNQCTFCAGKVSPSTQVAQPPAKTLPPVVSGPGCKEIAPRFEVHRPTSRVSIVVAKWVDDGIIILDFRGTQMKLSILDDGAHNHRWEPTMPPTTGSVPGVLAYHMTPLPKNSGTGTPLEKLTLRILSDDSVPWVMPKVHCSSTRIPWPPRPPPPPPRLSLTSGAQKNALQTAIHKGSQVGAPEAPSPAVQEITCETATLHWSNDSPERKLEYELVISAAASGAVSTIITSATAYKVEHLSSGTDLEFTLRARDPMYPLNGWSRHGRVSASTMQLSDKMPAPEPPSLLQSAEETCGSIQLSLPMLRRDCERETSLVLEYRVAGEAEWVAYSQEGLTSQRLQIQLPDTSANYEFRLVARRAERSSQPSAPLGPVTACGKLTESARNDEPVGLHSQESLMIAGAIFFTLLGLVCCYLYRVGNSSKKAMHKPIRKQNEDDSMSTLGNEDEITIHYDIEGAVQSGILPLEGISSIPQLLEEIADFGCELIESADIDVQDIEVYFEDQLGKKMKKVTTRTPLETVLLANSLSVTEKRDHFNRKKKRTAHSQLCIPGTADLLQITHSDSADPVLDDKDDLF
ncbi:MAG: hypothetical protein SGPRY_003136 [Prymnesium sp.]